MRIGLDVMGGDYYPQAPIAGVKQVWSQLPQDVELVLVGQPEIIEPELAKQGLALHERLHLMPASEVVGMSEHPAKAIAGKKDSSIVKALGALKSGALNAFISAGNTGALTAGAVLVLGMAEGVSRPAIGALYPRFGKVDLLLDVGANTDCKPEQLVQFAQMGTVFMQRVFKVEQPKVALLNIGEEASKGNAATQTAYGMLQEHANINFVGNAEGRDLPTGAADVYVCDGFVGNVLLKFAESFYSYMKQKLPNDEEIESFNFERVGGLPILGVNGNLIVGHGISGPLAYENMILRAAELVRSELVEHYQDVLS